MEVSTIIDVSFVNFNEFISKDLVIIDFWAEWCQPCQVQEKMIINILSKYPQSFVVGKINADDNRFLMKQLRVQTLPTLLFYKNGEEEGRLTGLNSQIVIENILHKLIN